MWEKRRSEGSPCTRSSERTGLFGRNYGKESRETLADPKDVPKLIEACEKAHTHSQGRRPQHRSKKWAHTRLRCCRASILWRAGWCKSVMLNDKLFRDLQAVQGVSVYKKLSIRYLKCSLAAAHLLVSSSIPIHKRTYSLLHTPFETSSLTLSMSRYMLCKYIPEMSRSKIPAGFSRLRSLGLVYDPFLRCKLLPSPICRPQFKLKAFEQVSFLRRICQL